ncbi:unnamed protein product (macronuclear) [Paramecium tetraurelia]|uniref:Uncharacterized protein n=1 Tax=Paramecium tetraurelia TaxID=5888 RepID=A0EE83_PARTE|nr:uncharacterized protein GSPATT00025944001 [Paramecium tetraurelia]CAK93600.1 unnamed protein product [Paramecium tetraurelia]|eukprot:XP_001460997.1 hypothetical protein (macronuclear) [Paramecium tetraurelia strain d4-2]
MNRLSSQPKTNNQGRMTPNEYMVHKNIPLPTKAKYPHADSEASLHKSEVIHQNNSSNYSHGQEGTSLQKIIEEKNREIEFLKQAEAQSKMLTTQFQEMNQNHQLEVKQLLEQIQNYKQRNVDLKSQVEQYMTELNKSNQKYQECCKERDEYLKNLREYSQDYDIMKMQLQGKDAEIVSLKERIQNIESSHQQELSQYSQTNEYWKRSLMDTQIREITQQFNQDRIQSDMKIKNLENRNVELENKCVLLAQEMERMRFKDLEQNKMITKNLQNENNELKAQMLEMMQFVSRYEEKINQMEYIEDQQQKDRMRIIVMSSEIDRLHCVIEEQEQQSHSFLQQIQRLEQYEMQCRMLQEQQQLQNQLKSQLQQEISKNQNTQQDFEYLQQEWTERNQELQDKCAMLTTELERLNLVMRDNETYSRNYQYEIEKFQKQLKDHSQIIEQKSNMILQLEIEISNYQQESMLLNSDNDNLNMRITQLEEEIQEVKDQTSQELKQQIDELNRNQYNYSQVNQDKLEMQKELEKINRDYQTLVITSQQKDDEIKDLQDQMQQMEEEHQIELSELQKQGEYLRSSVFDQQIRDLTVKFNNDKQVLEMQVRQLQQQKQEVELQNSLLQQKIQELQYTVEDQLEIQKQKLQTSEKERVNLLQEIKDYQLELHMISNERQQMREDFVKERMKIVVYASEIDRLWSVIQDQTDQIKQFEEQEQLSNEQLQQLTSTMQQYHNTIYQLEQEKNSHLRENSLKEQSLENKVIMMTNELDRTKNQLYEEQSKGYEQENKQKSLLQEIEELYQQIEQYQSEITIMQKNGLEVGDLETKFQAEKMSWETQKYQLTNQISDYEQRVHLLSQEIKRLTTIGDERLHEIEELRFKFRDASLAENYEQLKTEYDILEQQVMELEQNNLKLKSHTQTLEKQIQLLELSLQDKSKEAEDIYNLMNKQRRQSESTNKEAENNRKTQQQLQQAVSNLEQQNQYLKEQLQTLTNENKAYYHNFIICRIVYMREIR